MRHTTFLRNLLTIAPCAVALHVGAAAAQSDDLLIRASPVADYARYYAPYALQAAAAYLPVAEFDSKREAYEQPSLNGADVDIAVRPYIARSTCHGLLERDCRDLVERVSRATKFLRAWQYQFGSDRYLRCFDDADTDCQKEWGANWTLPIGGGPAFHVWARTRYPHAKDHACSEVSIAFRGTTGFLSDWITNADAATHYLADTYYVQLQRNIDAIIKKITQLGCYKRARHKPQIVSVGHSLGGGLAQFAALANKPTKPRITKVFAFDSSPFTGASLIDRKILLNNAEGLEIDRIYQTGEVLQYIRIGAEKLGLQSTFPKSSSRCRPQVRIVRFDAVDAPDFIGLHNMTSLAAKTIDLSYDGQGTQRVFDVPRRRTNDCPSRYKPPRTDEDESPPPSEQMVYAPDGSVTIVQTKSVHRRLAAKSSVSRTLRLKSNAQLMQASR